MDQAQFEQVLLATIAPDDAQRKPAEDMVTSWLKDPDFLSQHFVQAICHSPSMEVRQIATVLFRRYVFTIVEDSLWPRCSPAVKEFIKSELLQALINETEGPVRQKLADLVGTIAKTLAGTIGHESGHFWPEMLVTLWQCVQSPNVALKESALVIFSVVPALFGDQIERYLGEIRAMLSHSLHDTEHLNVQLAAAKAFSSFVLVLERNQRGAFAEHLPTTLDIIVSCLGKDETEGATSVLESLIDIAQDQPKFLKSQFDLFVDRMIQIAGGADIDEGCRQLAIEALVTLAESAPAMVRKFPSFAEKVIPLSLQLMMEHEEIPNWSAIDAHESEEEASTIATAGEVSMDRLAIALGGNTFLPVAFAAITHLLSLEQWQARYAALMSISAIGEGCEKQMRDHLTEVMQFVLPYFEDPHPRVRFAVCQAIGQMATDFGPKDGRESAVGFQSMFHAQVIPGLLHLMGQSDHPRVQAHAGAAMVNFAEQASKEIITPYLEPLLTAIGALLASPSIIVQEQAVTTLATVADSAEKQFQKYYGTFMPHLKHILDNAKQEQHRSLRAKTMEAVSLIGLAVGKELFMADALDVMRTLKETQDQMQAEDPNVAYMLSSWARICQILGPDFLPYLDIVMPALLQSAKLKPDIVSLDADQDEDDLDDPDNWQVLAIDDERIGIKTSTLEEKSTASEMLCVYAKELRGGFAAYLQEVSDIAQKHIKFYFDDGVRSSAYMIIPYLVICAREAPQFGEAAARSLFDLFLPLMLEGIKEEPEPEVLTVEFMALKELLEDADESVFTEQLVNELLEIVVGQLQEHEERVLERMQMRASDEDYDHEVEANLTDEESHEFGLISEVAHLIRVLFGKLKTAFLPFFDTILHAFTSMLQPSRPVPDKQWALCVFDDLIEFTEGTSLKYREHFLDLMLRYVSDPSPEVRQAAVYGVGMMALHGGADYVAIVKEVLPHIIATINAPDSRANTNVDATENAISAFVKIIRNPVFGISPNESIPLLMEWLPVTEDDEEAEYIYDYFSDLILADEALVLQEGYYCKIISIFAAVLNTSLLPSTSHTSKKLVLALKHIETRIPAEHLQAIWTALTPEQQERLSAAATS